MLMDGQVGFKGGKCDIYMSLSKKTYKFIKKYIEPIAALCIVVGFFSPFAFRYLEGGTTAKYEVLATAGDWLAGTSAPFFSVAVSLLMYGAYKIQKKELRLTRKEMKQTRKEFKTQNETLKRQEFETTFFHLLELHHQIVESILYKSASKEIYQGRQFVSFAYSELKRDYENYYLQFYALPTINEVSPEQFDSKCLQTVFSKNFPAIERNMGHYFKNFFQTLRLLDKSILNAEEKIDFAKLLIAQLTNDELCLLYYQCIYDDENIEFGELVRRYGFFDTIDKAMLLTPENFQLVYSA